MSLNTKRLFFVIINCFISAFLSAQTLYWVGGSGNFNDPQHWSATSGGQTSNLIPNLNTDVVFDDNSASKGYFIVNINSNVQTKSFSTPLNSKAIKFSGTSNYTVNVSGSLTLSNRVKFEALTDFIFESTSNSLNSIDFGNHILNSNVTVKSGNYNFLALSLLDSKTIRFGSGRYFFDSVVISAGDIINEDGTANFTIKDSYFKTLRKFRIAQDATVKSDGAYIMADINSPINYSIPNSLQSSKNFTSVNSVNVVCPVTISLTPACTGSCTGVLTVSLSPTCTNTPYSVQVTNGTCPAFAAALSNTNIPSVYTVTNACACAANYIIVVRDASSSLQAATNTANFTPNSAIIFDNNISPQCSYSCDGSLQGSIIGTAPFTVAIVASGTTTIPTFTTALGDYTITNMCAGNYTFNITDASGCFSSQTNSLIAPAPLLSNAVTSSIVCNGFNTGSLSITPTGGTANYTVNFSNSTTFTTSGSVVAATGLGVGPISATVTDSHGCTDNASGNITQPTPALNSVYGQTDLVCNSVCTGAASATVTGGTPPYSYNWTPAAPSTSVITNLCAGQRTLNVSDFNGCTTATQIFTITQPSTVTVVPSFTNVVCSGSCTGVASVQASGGTAPYFYTFVSPVGPSTISAGSTNSVTNLCAGVYTVFIRDGGPCTNSITITIAQPPAVTLTTLSQSVSCFGLTDGSATVTAAGGNSASYTYSWTPGSMTTPIITGLGAGVYNVTVFDAQSCPTLTFVTIIQPSLGLTPVVSFTNLTCNPANSPCDGRINASPTGGTPPYTYTLATSSTTITSAPPYNSLCTNTYALIVKDLSGCPQQVVIVLNQPGALTPSITITTSLACFGSTLGGLTGNPSGGGTPGYTLNWTTPTGTATGATLNNQGAGNFTLAVIDSKSCTAQTTIALTQPSVITIGVNTPSISCFATCNGVITSTVSGGTGAYSYAWTNSLSANVGTNVAASALCPGPYTLTVTDANSCVRTSTAAVLSPGPIVISSTTTPVNCFGDFNGTASVIATGGTPAFNSYTLASGSSTNISAFGIFGGLPAGTYTVFAQDAATCLQTTLITVASPTALAAAISGTGSCNVCNGTATITASFGTAPYTYLWTSSLSGTFATTPTVASLCPANYTATVTDSKGCTVTRTISIIQIISVTVTATPSSILCNGATTGSATASQGGGVPGYTYSWTPSSQTASVLANVGAGSYTVRVTDSSIPACSHTAAITLTQPPAITVTATQTNVTCFGYTNAAVTTTINGGTGPYTQTWTPGGLLTTSLNAIGAGVYTLNVRDFNQCPAVKTISVTQPTSISISLAVTNPVGCVGSAINGSICATASGGAGSGYIYTLTPAGITNTTGCFTGLGGGSYSIIVSDASGCSNNTFTTLSSPASPTITVNSTSVACYGFSTAIATATATGLTPSFTFSWTSGVTFTTNAAGNTGTTTGASSLGAGIYFVTATDGFGCVSSQSINITQASSVTINSNFNNLTCNNVSTGSITVAPTGGTPAYTFSWLPTTSVTTGQGTGTVSGLAAGIYTLNLTDTHTCLTVYTFSITQPPALSLTAVTSSLMCFNVCTGSIVANASGGTGAITYSWSPMSSSSPSVTNLCANTGTNPTAYTLTVTDLNLCTKTNTFVITQPNQLTSTVNITNASCSNSCNAIASQTASGGTPTYSYSWSSSPSTTSTLGALCSGTYIATITDGNGCSFANQFTITPPAPLSVTLTPSNPLCNNACNGSIATNVSGAQGIMSYTWLPAGIGQNPSGLCATPNPIYTLVARDQNSCQVTANATLTNPPAMIANVSFTNPLCNGNTNGAATVSFTNAIGATTYTWIPTGPPTQTAQTATGLGAGAYTVTVKDNNQCLASHSFSITDPSTITVNTSISAASCSLNNGAITLNPTGGTPGTPAAYTFSWVTVVSTSSVVTNLFAGPYVVLVTDGAGCTTTATALLPNANGPTLTPVTSSSIVCNAQCTGAASVVTGSISGGTSPYSAMWIAPAPSTLNPLSNLCAGSYTAQIFDAAGCISFTDVTIAEPPPIVINPIVGLPICPGICNGTIDINASGGNAPYTYTWAPVSSNSPTLSGLCAGDYTVVIGYNSGCTDTSFINIPDMSSITIVPTVTNNICFGTCSAVATVSVSGGTSPYNVSWSNSQTGSTITNLCNGDYTVSITDNNGCNNTATTSISSGPQMTSTTAVVSPSCGLCNGTASVTVIGGTTPLTYNWSNSATTPTLSNMCAGLYQVVVTDALSCSQTHTVIINNSNGITGETINTQQIPCSGSCVGAATVAAIGGNAPISYNWISPASSSSIITNLCPGTYFVQMSDAQNCVRIASVTINPLVSLTVSPFVQLPACNSSDGSINLVISGGTPSYSIVWNPPAGNTTSITGINSGVYSFTVTESGTNSCSVSQVINMSNSTGPVLTVEQYNVKCFDACTGSITVVASSTNGPLSYNWSNGANTPTVGNVCPGVISVTVTDQGGCKTIRSFTITDNPRLRLVGTTIENPSCAGDCDGVITLNPSGGVFPYTFSWTPVTSAANPLTALCDGVYSAQVLDSKGCFVNSPSYTIVSSSFLILSSSTFSSSCSSVADGTIRVVPSGGVSEYLFSWQGPSGYTATTQNLTNIYSGNYTVTVTDNVGCQKDSVLSVVPSITIVARAGDNAVICQETGSVVIDGNASSGSFSYKWYKLSDNVNSIASTPSYTVRNLVNPETYVLVATSSVAACFDSDTIDVNLYPVPFVDAGRDYTVPIYTSVQIGGNPTSPSAVSLTWAPAAYLSDPNSSNPIASSTLVTTYTVTMTDVNGCTVSDSITVDLYPELKISSGFSPNNDGKNDLWLIDYIDQFPNTSVEIYNRWGDRVFEAPKGYETPFDGKYKGTDLPVGTYYYIININHPGYPKPITGPLTIFR